MSSVPFALPPRRLVLGDLVTSSRTGAVVLTVSGAALIGLLAQVAVPLPGTPVPLTGQTLGVLLVAAALGLRRGVAATALYGAAGIAGVPWFTGAASGWSGMSFGYVLGFVVAAVVAGALAERGWDRAPGRAMAAMALANAVILLCGSAWLAALLRLDLWQAIQMGVLPFLAGDAVKIALAAALLPAAWRLSGSRARR
ncbi:biotin transporter BioY [Nonomuraea sp. C10]|uniref:biotin transporter BioY n=1 Tax=Nonomuraea sp. C10 TaxID=2600577 RepID=UPI0011CEB35D|nr:biotin transporter BioY [Nonomuraea sp. C10]TXK42610.1 biotin transporter BioY [Nonomuraea sp. C10]